MLDVRTRTLGHMFDVQPLGPGPLQAGSAMWQRLAFFRSPAFSDPAWNDPRKRSHGTSAMPHEKVRTKNKVRLAIWNGISTVKAFRHLGVM